MDSRGLVHDLGAMPAFSLAGLKIQKNQLYLLAE